MGLSTKQRTKNILNHLRENGRASQTKIARQEGIVTSRVHLLHKALEKKYITRYVTFLHYEAIGHPFRSICILKQNKAFSNKTLSKAHSINNIKLLNQKNMLIESVHKSLAEQEEFLEELKEKGQEIQSQHNIITILAQEKIRIN